jgi:hypothetical protein
MLNGDKWPFEVSPLGERGGEAGILGFDRRAGLEGVVEDLGVRSEPVACPVTPD